jgi:hypothetical protein
MHRTFADGMLAEAMKACIRSLQAEETPAAKALFVRLLKTGTTYDNRFVRPYLIRALTEPWCRTGQLVPAALTLIKSNRDAGQCIERAVASWPTVLSKVDIFGTAGLAALAADDLLIAVLENTPAAGLEFEHFLVLARRALLLEVVASPSPHRSDASLLRFCCAMARQCDINEYVYNCMTEEEDGVTWLRDAILKCLDEATPVPGAWVAPMPLFPVVPASRLRTPRGSHDGAAVTGLFSQQVREPLQEEISRHAEKADTDRRRPPV